MIFGNSDRSLQTFKLNVASSIVNQQNAALATMNTDQILDLFNAKDVGSSIARVGGGQEGAVDAEGNPVKKGGKNVLEDLSELWDEKEYEEEYDMSDYLSSLKSTVGGNKSG
jgi:TATA-binding protein-associated factor